MDAGADHAPALAHRTQHKLAGRREQDRGVEQIGRRFLARASLRRAQAARKRLGGNVALTRERKDFPALMDGNLADGVRSR